MLIRLSKTVLSAVIVLCVITLFTFQFFGLHLLVVSGDSMLPTYTDGSLLLARDIDQSNLALLDGFPVCWVELPSGNSVLKRLIGRPGQVVVLADGDTFVDGQPVQVGIAQREDAWQIALKEDQYVFLGDNREDSLDSRHWSPAWVTLAQIKGVVLNSALE